MTQHDTPPADRAAVIAATVRACADHLRSNYSDMWTADAARSLNLNAARIERGESTALLRRMADEAQPTQAAGEAAKLPPMDPVHILGIAAGAPHACRNCEGADPDTCLMNPDRTARP